MKLREFVQKKIALLLVITMVVGMLTSSVSGAPVTEYGGVVAETSAPGDSIDLAGPIIIVANAPDGTIDVAYSFQFAATGYPIPDWFVIDGFLPTGLNLSTGGALTGTPTALGTFGFTVEATNSQGAASVAVTIVISAAPALPAITVYNAPDGEVGIAYDFDFAATGYPIPDWFVVGGTLPPGLSLTTGGALSGTPGLAGTFTFTVMAANSSGFDNREITVVIAATPEIPEITVYNAPDGVVDEVYSFQFEATGYPIPTWSYTGTLPPGLTLSTTSGALTGTPTAAGTFTFTVTAENSVGDDSQAVTIVIAEAPVVPEITVYNAPDGTVGDAYNFQFVATGYPVPTWSYTGDLPDGLTLSTTSGALTGTPTVGGTFTFTVTAENSEGDDSQTITVVIVAVPVVTVYNAPDGTVGDAYNFQFEATGYPVPTWSYTGDLPDGLTLGTDGTLSGTPTEAGTFIFTVTATNSAGSDSQTVTVVISPALEAPEITVYNAPDGVVGDAYSFEFEATGYPAPAWSSIGNLPPGLTLAANGELTGTPTLAGSFTFFVVATNSVGFDYVEVTVVITPALEAPVITVYNAPDGTVGDAYSFEFEATGYPVPTWSYTGDLPDGLTLGTDGTLSGTPTVAGPFTFTVTATNSEGSDSQTVTVVITPALEAPEITVYNAPDGVVGDAYSFEFEATGYPVPTWSSIGNLPPGLTLAANGELTGTPTLAGSFTFFVVATNSMGADSVQVTVVITPALEAPVITVYNAPDGTVGDAYSFQFEATGYPVPVWSYTGDLPDGLTLTTDGALSGIPTAGGSFTFTVRAENSEGYDYVEVTIVITAAPVITVYNAPDGVVGDAYSFELEATGYPVPAWSSIGNLPPGLTLAANGELTGTPTLAGSFTFFVVATNSVGFDYVEVTVVISPAPEAPVITVYNAPDGVPGTAYNFTFEATGYPVPVWSYTGSLPLGLTLAADGLLSGTPTATGIFTFTVIATNSEGYDYVEVTILICNYPYFNDCECPHCQYLAWRAYVAYREWRHQIYLAEIAHQEYLAWRAYIAYREWRHEQYLAWLAYIAYQEWRHQQYLEWRAYMEWREWLCATDQCEDCNLCD